MPPKPGALCSQPPDVLYEATCATGCTVTAALMTDDIGKTPASLCQEAPDAKDGDPCSVASCRPTRAVLASDGTVASKIYLRCDTSTNTCAAAAAPVVASYLQPCDAAIVSMYGTPNVNGLHAAKYVDSLGACLLAWDAATSTVHSGITTKCLGDWQCPDGSLCDDQIAPLVTLTEPVAVCKPGPRGVLTPAMLSP